MTRERISNPAAEIMADAGRLLYGTDWQSPLARDLGVSRDSVRRWLTGRMPLPHDHGAMQRLHGILLRASIDAEARAPRLAAMAERIKRAKS